MGRFTTCGWALFIASSAVWAGERLTAKQLVDKSDAIALVTVKLTPDSDAISLQSTDWLIGQFSGETLSKMDTSSGCLPGTRQLQKWQKQHPKWSQAEQWKEALSRGEYRTIAFFKRAEGGGWAPFCDAESMLVEGWVTHPKHSAYRKQVNAALQTKSLPSKDS
jgi:hypothetical protein